MANPPIFQPGFNYSNWQATNPVKPLPAQQVDNDFANAARSINQAISAIGDVRRSDGKLKNGIVGPDALAPQFSLGFSFEGTWADGVEYQAGDGVVFAQTFYAARASHTSSVSNQPPDDDTWTLLFSLDDIVVAGALSMPAATFLSDDETTDFDLGFFPVSSRNVFVTIGGQIQDPAEYTVNGSMLKFFSAPPTGPLGEAYTITARGFATTATLVVPQDGSVTTPKLADSGVTRPKLSSELAKTIPQSPFYYGSVGDGTTDDAATYAVAEAANASLYLPSGFTFNLGAAFPGKPISGPGALKLGANTYAGNQLTYDPYRTEALFRPESFYRKTGAFPAGSRHLNMIFSPSGPPANASVNRSTILGNANAVNAIAIDRVDLFGDGAGRLMRYGERNTLIGNISGEQLGAPDTSQNNFWISAGGFVPGDAGWDYQGLKTKNPTIGATIAAWIATNPFATVTTDVRAMVGLGRDTFNGSLKGQNSTAIGYQASASNLFPQGMTTIGTQANQYGIFTTNSFVGGYLAAVDWQEGTRGTVVGYQAATALVRGSQWTAIGAFAGSNYTDLDDSILIGFGAGNGMSLTQANGLLAIGVSGNPLIGGNLKSSGGTYTGPNAGINIAPALIKGTWHVRTSDFGATQSAHGNADDLIVENSGNTGISIRMAASGQATIFAAIPGTTNKHGLVFNDSASSFTVRVASSDKLFVTSTGMGFNGTAAIAKPTVTGSKGANAALTSLLTALASYGLVVDSST